MSNSEQLRMSLQTYHDSLIKHATVLKDQLPMLETRWLALRQVYEGEAAEQFHLSWSRTLAWLPEHLGQVQDLANLLQERLDGLTELTQSK